LILIQVNKLPGSSSITLKVELARTKLKWIPLAFSIPDEEASFSLAVSTEKFFLSFYDIYLLNPEYWI